MNHVRFLATTIAALALAVASAEGADDRCAATKVGAAGKAAKSAVTCALNALSKPGFDEAACEAKLADKLARDFTKADSFGECDGSAGGCRYVSGSCATAVAEATEPPGTPEGCRGKLLKAAAKYAQAILKCDSGFYLGRDATSVGECRDKALAKLNKLFLKTAADQGTCAPLTTGVLAGVIDDACGHAVRADLAETAHICQVCCQGRLLGETIGCAAGDADVVGDGCERAATLYELTDYTFEAVSSASHCSGETGACVAADPGHSGAVGCCQVELDGELACSQGPPSMEAIEACVSGFSGTVNPGFECINGQVCGASEP